MSSPTAQNETYDEVDEDPLITSLIATLAGIEIRHSGPPRRSVYDHGLQTPPQTDSESASFSTRSSISDSRPTGVKKAHRDSVEFPKFFLQAAMRSTGGSYPSTLDPDASSDWSEDESNGSEAVPTVPTEKEQEEANGVGFYYKKDHCIYVRSFTEEDIYQGDVLGNGGSRIVRTCQLRSRDIANDRTSVLIKKYAIKTGLDDTARYNIKEEMRVLEILRHLVSSAMVQYIGRYYTPREDERIIQTSYIWKEPEEIDAMYKPYENEAEEEPSDENVYLKLMQFVQSPQWPVIDEDDPLCEEKEGALDFIQDLLVYNQEERLSWHHISYHSWIKEQWYAMKYHEVEPERSHGRNISYKYVMVVLLCVRMFAGDLSVMYYNIN
ncbi:hypothetical protein M422DRAFT_53121 [Sphaerobolus stellatus SS14]|uniref:Uncharacterized protein n=1 Tax=Sphaerobolus stellatus (strain SS14) TaxID=990650 RepID=A0A0C9V384_SPHS4|nr:hypothetical protein M422DRAFT_53121 [Sphaerobolus stellatus SS14]